MKRKLLVFLLVAAAAVAVHAGSALAASMTLDPVTGNLTYTTQDASDAARDPTLKNHVELMPANWTGGYNVAIVDHAWTYPWNPMGINLFVDANVPKHCLYDSWGYFGSDRAWVCQAKHVTVRTGGGDDEIDVSPDLKLPTQLEGGAGHDWIQGGGGSDLIYGGCSADPTCDGFGDTLRGGAGSDALHGGSAIDVLDGEAGNDLLDGGLGGDILNGGPDKDYADYSSRTVAIVASLDGVRNDGQTGEADLIGTDVEGISGGSGKDTLYGNDGPNNLTGGGGDDYLVGYGGDDELWGGYGSDLLRPGFGKDVVYGGSEPANTCCKFDTVTYSERWNPVNVSIDGVANDGEAGEADNVAPDVENVVGGDSNDTLTGNKYGNALFGGLGTDSLDGKGGGGVLETPGIGLPDKLNGGPGNDVLYGGPVSNIRDVIDGGPDTDMVTYASRTTSVKIWLDGSAEGEDTITNVENATGGSGDDAIAGNAGPNFLIGSGGNDNIGGYGGDDTLQGKDGNDILDGGSGNDMVSGDDGADTLTGGPGADYLSGWTGVDTVSYQNVLVPMTITLDGTANDGATGENDNVMPDVETVIGGSAADKITGAAATETLIGGAGPDTLNGMGGDDTLNGGAGGDVLHGGDGDDTLDAGSENDQLFGDAGYDTLRGGLGNDQLHGGADGDAADYSTSGAAVTVNLASKTSSGGQGADTLFDSVENITGSNFSDVLTGDAGPNTILGFGGSDTIVGAGGNDHLAGADGADTLRGDSGDDQIDGGPGIDTATYANAAGAVTVDLSVYNASASGSAGNDWLLNVENVTGSAYADKITGSTAANVLLGGAGNDTLLGLGGNDKLDGQTGVDNVDGGADVDTCLAETKANCEQ